MTKKQQAQQLLKYLGMPIRQQGVRAGKIYVTAFPSRKLYAKFFGDLAWETDAWIAPEPDHLVHMNGDRFMGPRNLDA